MIPEASKHESSVHEHLLEMIVIFAVLVSKKVEVVEVGDARVLRVPANIHDLAAACQQLRWEQCELEKGLEL